MLCGFRPWLRTRILWCAFAAATLTLPTFAQRAIVRRFDVAGGLPSSRVSSITADSRGYLWVATWRGLARFDGQRFRVFDATNGLTRSLANEVREDPHGRLWVALNGDGVARLEDEPDARGRARFRIFAADAARQRNTVNALHFDDDGRMWIGTEGGLACATELADGALSFEFAPDSVACSRPQAACRTTDGTLWFVGIEGIASVRDGRVERTALPEVSRVGEYLCVTPRSTDELLVGNDRTLWSFRAASRTWSLVPLELATNQGIRTLLVDSRDDLWVGTTSGLIRVRGERALLYTTDQGLPDNSIRCGFEDGAGRLWFGTWQGGVAQLGPGSPRSWTRSVEMPNPDVTALVAARSGRVIASTVNDGLFELDERGSRRLGAELSPRFDRIWARFCEVPGRGWLVGTADELSFVAGEELDLSRARRFGAAEGCADVAPINVLALDEVGGVLVADRGGRLLQGNIALDGTTHFTDLLESEDRARFAALLDDSIRELARAPDGTPWIASRRALARRVDGRFEFIRAGAGLPATELRALLFDRRGRLWVALRYDGVARCDDPDAEHPRWTHVEPLIGQGAFALAEDPVGRMYVGTWNGVFELDVDGRLMRHFTSAGGLASDFVNALCVDPSGAVWVGTSGGVTRLDPNSIAAVEAPPRAWIERVERDGEPLAVPARGARELGPFEFAAGPGTLFVEYGAPWLASEQPLAFQLRLDGVDGRWSEPSADRHVRFARLAAGDYRLLVRPMLTASGTHGDSAILRFSIPPPWWRRPGVLALAVLGAGAAAFALHRMRLRQVLALERVRSGIALDLHDELGADLTQVAILSEVARRAAPERDGAALAKVAELARDMRASLADIVWSVDPRRDRVGDLAVRLRELGGELVEAGGLDFALTVDADREVESLPLAPDERRGLYLIAKESLHNAIKHAAARRIDVALRVRGRALALAIRDDGRGFDTDTPTSGHGLRGLHARAQKLGAQLSVRSEVGGGTAIELALRLRGDPA